MYTLLITRNAFHHTVVAWLVSSFYTTPNGHGQYQSLVATVILSFQPKQFPPSFIIGLGRDWVKSENIIYQYTNQSLRRMSMGRLLFVDGSRG